MDHTTAIASLDGQKALTVAADERTFTSFDLCMGELLRRAAIELDALGPEGTAALRDLVELLAEGVAALAVAEALATGRQS